jgi:hypothetical protein
MFQSTQIHNQGGLNKPICLLHHSGIKNDGKQEEEEK